MQVNDTELSMLRSIHAGRIREVDHIVDRRTFEELQWKSLVFVSKGRPRVPRNHQDIAQSVRRYGRVTMVQHDEAHLTAVGLRTIAERKS